MTQNERTALAMLRSGFSWQDASDASHVSIDRLKELWAANGAPSKRDDANRR